MPPTAMKTGSSFSTVTEESKEYRKPRFTHSTKAPVDHPPPRRKHQLRRHLQGPSLEGDEAKQQEIDHQPRLWLCCASELAGETMTTTIFEQATETASSSPSWSPSTHRHQPACHQSGIPHSPFSFTEQSIDDWGFTDDMSNMVSVVTRDFSTKTPVAHNRGKKPDVLQPIYDRMGLFTRKEKKSLRKALSDLFLT